MSSIHPLLIKRQSSFRKPLAAGIVSLVVLGAFATSGLTRAGDELGSGTPVEPCRINPNPDNVIPRFREPGWGDLRRAVKGLDRLRNKVEEWGAVTISAPVAVFSPGAFSVPAEILTPEKIYEEVKKERSATAFQSTDIGINNQFGAVVTPTTIPGLGLIGNSGAGTSTTTTTTQTNLPPLYDSQGKIRLGLDAESLQLPQRASTAEFGPLAAPFTLVPGATAPTGSVDDWFDKTNNIIVRQKIFAQMSKPEALDGYTRIFFCVVQVSCNPGWRTKQHYIADCSASLEYYNSCEKDSLSRALQRAPTVFSVLPLIDAQTVEMANSQREVTQLAFQLAASLPAKGVDLKAKELFEFVRRYSREMRSVTPIPVVNSYSSGGTFGFRFSPSFQALSDPAQKKARAANVLLPTSFPALVTVLVKDIDVRHAIIAMKQPDPGTLDGELPNGLSIMTHISTRWYLKDRPPLYQFYKRIYTPMKRDTAAGDISTATDLAIINDAKALYKQASRGGGGSGANYYDPTYDELRRILIDLESKGVGRSWPIDISGKFLAKAKETGTRRKEETNAQEKISKLEKDLKDAKAAIEKLKATNDNFLKEENDNLWNALRARTGAVSNGDAGATAQATTDEDAPTPRAIFVAPPRRTASLETPFDRLPFPLEPALPTP